MLPHRRLHVGDGSRLGGITIKGTPENPIDRLTLSSLSPSARRDLRDVVRYISLDSPERAVTFGQFLVSNAKRLADFPGMGRVVPEFDDPSIREIVVRSYRVIYRVDHADCRADVTRSWHGARSTPEIEGN